MGNYVHSPTVDAITIRLFLKQTLMTKYFDESFGLFLRDITDRVPSRSYKHIEIKLKPAQQITIPGRGSRVLNNCLILQADNEIKDPFAFLNFLIVYMTKSLLVNLLL